MIDLPCIGSSVWGANMSMRVREAIDIVLSVTELPGVFALFDQPTQFGD